MSMTVDGTWKAGVWASTVWADGVWREGSSGDFHDGDYTRIDEALRKQEQAFRQARDKLRSDLLRAVEKVTGKPPPLDMPLKGLAAIARKSEGFDYEAMLNEITALEAKRYEDSVEVEAIRNRNETRQREAVLKQLELAKLAAEGDEEAIMLLLAML